MADLFLGIWIDFVKALWILFPAYAANIFPPLAKGKRPLDMGKKWKDGNRILGNGKTIEGTLYGIAMGTFYGGVEWYLSPTFNSYANIFGVQLPTMNLLVAFLIGLGAMAGDLTGSFIKRRMGLQRGEHAPFFLDKLNFIFGTIIFTFLFTEYTLGMIMIMVLITPLIHRLANIFGYVLKFKKEPW